MKTKKKQLKIYYAHHGNSLRRHPFIRLSGRYLVPFGFKIGDVVEVTIKAGIILITKVPTAPES